MLVSELIDRTLAEWLHPAGDEQPQFDTLQDDIDASVAQLTLTGRAERVPRSSTLEIGSEVIQTSSSSGTVVDLAERGFAGSTPAAHSAGDIVWIDPTFTRVELLHALRSVVGKLFAWGLYGRDVDTSQTFTMRGVITAPAGTKRILSIAVRSSSADENYTELKMRGVDWVELKQFDPIKYRIRKSAGAEGAAMNVVLQKNFVLPDSEADDLTATCLLSEEIQEDLPMAVAGQVLKGREVPRVTMDRIREALAAAGLNPGVTMNIGDAMIRSFRQDAVMAERQRLEATDETAFEWVRS